MAGTEWTDGGPFGCLTSEFNGRGIYFRPSGAPSKNADAAPICVATVTEAPGAERRVPELEYPVDGTLLKNSVQILAEQWEFRGPDPLNTLKMEKQHQKLCKRPKALHPARYALQHPSQSAKGYMRMFDTLCCADVGV